MKNALQKGFILFSVLLFLQIFSALSLYGLTTTKWMIRGLYEQAQSQFNHAMGNIILTQVENFLLEHVPLCFIPINAASLLTKKNNEWWQINGCHGNFQESQYDYVVEWLGKDTCTHVIKRDNYHDGLAEYYRITLRVLPNASRANFFLQSVIVKANNEQEHCSQRRHEIKEGRQMRRELVGRTKT